MWIVDLSTCVGCIEELQAWDHLGQSVEFPVHIVFLGSGESAARIQRRGVRNVQAWYAEPQSIRTELGPVMASSKLLMRDGYIVLAQTTSGGGCSWSFEAQVATLASRAPAERIRPAVADYPNSLTQGI